MQRCRTSVKRLSATAEMDPIDTSADAEMAHANYSTLTTTLTVTVLLVPLLKMNLEKQRVPETNDEVGFENPCRANVNTAVDTKPGSPKVVAHCKKCTSQTQADEYKVPGTCVRGGLT